MSTMVDMALTWGNTDVRKQAERAGDRSLNPESE